VTGPGGMVGVHAHSPSMQVRMDVPGVPNMRAARPAGVGARLPAQSTSQGPPSQKVGTFGVRPGGEADAGDQNGMVVAFLRDAGLEQYASALLRSGFDDLDTLLSIEDADMKDLGIATCHVVRLRKKLQELQRQRNGGKGELDANNPVVLFLEDAGLGQYAKLFLQNGFDDMDVLFDLEDTDMKDLGIPRGHAIRLKKKLREQQLHQYAHEDAMPVYTAASYQQVVQIRTPQRRAPMQIPASALHAVPTEQMKSAVEQSWEQVQALGTYTVGEILYRHTFVVMPEAIHLFPAEVRMKYREWSSDEGNDESNVYESPALKKLFSKFVNAVGCAVVGLHDSSKLVPMLTQLGARHINYGVSEAHWQALGKAFKSTLRDILRESFTQEVEAAWAMAYTFMSSIMIEGLRGAIAARDGGRLAHGGLGDLGEKASMSGESTGHGSAVSEHAEEGQGGAAEEAA